MQAQIFPDAIDPDADTKSFQTQLIPMQTLPDAIDPDADTNPSRRN